MVVFYLAHLRGVCSFHCGSCGMFLTKCENCFERDFFGEKGRAYLFNNVENVKLGMVWDKWMNTGRYKVRDVFCHNCRLRLGWRYEHAFGSEQSWKVGNTMLWGSLMTTSRRQHTGPVPPPPDAPPQPHVEPSYEYLDPVF